MQILSGELLAEVAADRTRAPASTAAAVAPALAGGRVRGRRDVESMQTVPPPAARTSADEFDAGAAFRLVRLSAPAAETRTSDLAVMRDLHATRSVEVTLRRIRNGELADGDSTARQAATKATAARDALSPDSSGLSSSDSEGSAVTATPGLGRAAYGTATDQRLPRRDVARALPIGKGGGEGGAGELQGARSGGLRRDAAPAPQPHGRQADLRPQPALACAPHASLCRPADSAANAARARALSPDTSDSSDAETPACRAKSSTTPSAVPSAAPMATPTSARRAPSGAATPLLTPSTRPGGATPVYVTPAAESASSAHRRARERSVRAVNAQADTPTTATRLQADTPTTAARLQADTPTTATRLQADTPTTATRVRCEGRGCDSFLRQGEVMRQRTTVWTDAQVPAVARMSIELSPDDSTSDSDGDSGDSDRPQV